MRSPLLEREAELAVLDNALQSACSGAGAVVVVRGEPGTGKSRLLVEATERAAQAGMQVLRARGHASERAFSFGVALQLLEAPTRATAEAAALLSGPGRHARALLEDAAPDRSLADSERLFAVVHGLYSVTRALAEPRPLVLAVDDLQWTDESSTRFLAYVANRIAGLPIALVIAQRTGEEIGWPSPIDAHPAPGVLDLRPLSSAAVTEVVRAALPEASAGFCAACTAVTGGNPFYVQELVRTVQADGIDPSDEASDRVRELAPGTVARSVLLRLSQLPARCEALARAIAVLGEAPLAEAAAVAHLEFDDATAAAAALARAGVLADSEPVSFSHPIVRGVIEGDATEAERGRLRLAAAEVLLARDAPAQRVAAQLLAAPACGQAWVVEPLRRAAAHALGNGAPASAVRYLRRALQEPPTCEALPELLLELGRAEAIVADPQAVEHLEDAVARLRDPVARGRASLVLGRALWALGRLGEAAEAFEHGSRALGDADPDLAAELEAGYISVARLDPKLYPAAVARIEALVAQPPARDAPGQRALLADVALARAWAGAPVAEVLPLARRAWASGALLAEQGPEAQAIYILTGALYSIDELDFELEVVDAALRTAHERGSIMAAASASVIRAHPLWRQARVAEALAAARQAVAAERDGWQAFLPIARAYCSLSALELDDLHAATEPLDLTVPDAAEGSVTFVPYLEARARLRLAQHRPQEALADAQQAGRTLEQMFAGTRARGLSNWMSIAVRSAAAVGKHEIGRQLSEEDLALAEGRDRDMGVALTAAAALEHGERRIELLERAVQHLDGCQSTLDFLHALVDLGGALRRTGRRADARTPLSRALDLATSRGALALARRAREELLATGARPRRTAQRGVDALTPSELRVARLAAQGLRNREIAEELVVTVKTVDYHLRHVYQKLGGGRQQLAAAFEHEPA